MISVTRPRSRRSRAWRRSEGRRTWRVTIRERSAALRSLRGLLLVLLPGTAASGGGGARGKELKMEVRSARGEGRVVLEEVRGM